MPDSDEAYRERYTAMAIRYYLTPSKGAVRFHRLARRPVRGLLENRELDPFPDLGLDHVTVWNFNKRPAMILSEPYHLNNAQLVQTFALAEFFDLMLRVVEESPHFPGRTIGVQFWNKAQFAAVSTLQRKLKPPTARKAR